MRYQASRSVFLTAWQAAPAPFPGWSFSGISMGEHAGTGLSSSADPDLQALLIAFFRPERIFRLTSSWTARATELLLVLPDRCLLPFTEIEPTLTALRLVGQQDVAVSVYKSAEVHRQLLQGHPFYSLVFVPANLVYEHQARPLVATPPDRLRQVIYRSRLDFDTGLAKAAGFLQSAVDHRQSGDPCLSAFLLHQAAELTLRALLLGISGKAKKSHSIALLYRSALQLAPELREPGAACGDEFQRLFETLESAYGGARYDSSYSIAYRDLDLLIVVLQQLLRCARAAFTRHFSGSLL